jgi:hypothetical protein
MNKRQNNQLRMFDTVNVTLDNHSRDFSDLTGLVTSHQKLKGNISAIKQLQCQQETNYAGLTENKIQVRAALLKPLAGLSAALVAYAGTTGDNELKVKARVTESRLRYATDTKLFATGTLLAELATPLQNELAAYFITPEKLTEIGDLLTQLNNAMPKKRVADTEGKVLTTNLRDLFRSTGDLLKKEVDVLMLLFAETHPDFYNAYKNARIIIDYAGGAPTGDDDEPGEGDEA